MPTIPKGKIIFIFKKDLRRADVFGMRKEGKCAYSGMTLESSQAGLCQGLALITAASHLSVIIIFAVQEASHI